MQLTCSHGNKRASTFETWVAEIHWQTVSKDLGFATPTLSSNTTIDRLAQARIIPEPVSALVPEA
jgi:hypothetical protein